MSQTYWWSLYGDLAGKPTGIFFAGVLVLVGAMCFDLCGDLFVKQNSPSSELVSGSVHPDCWRAYGCFRLDAKPAFYTCLLLAGIGGGIATVLAGTDCPMQGMVPANGSSSDDNWVHSTGVRLGRPGPGPPPRTCPLLGSLRGEGSDLCGICGPLQALLARFARCGPIAALLTLGLQHRA